MGKLIFSSFCDAHKMLGLERDMQKIKVDVEYYEQKIRLINREWDEKNAMLTHIREEIERKKGRRL